MNRGFALPFAASEAFDILEHMFEYEGMSPLAAADRTAPRGVLPARAVTTRTDRVTTLQSRIHSMQKRGLDERAIPTVAALGPLLPGGNLHKGAVYSTGARYSTGAPYGVPTSLLFTMLSEASSSGLWCAIVGIGDLGYEAATAAGLNLDQLILVPRPAEHWLTVTSALLDSVPLVVVSPPDRVSAGEAARLSARLRQRGSTMIVRGDWPGADAHLTVTKSTWSGLGAGSGYLDAHSISVSATFGAHRERERTATISLPATPGAKTLRGEALRGEALRGETAAIPLHGLAV